MGLRWPGFRKVRGQVAKRLRRRLSELGLGDLDAYRAHLEHEPEEWARLERLTHITISRFHRDRGTFAMLWAEVLPALAGAALQRGDEVVRAWSAGCASGEEAYTVAIGWRLSVAPSFPGLRLCVLATDVEDAMLARAGRACYGTGSLRELPEAWRRAAFTPSSRGFCLRDEFKAAVSVVRHDVRADPLPKARFDLVMCRNVAFTYFDGVGQRAVAARLAGVLREGGALVVGKHETLPEGVVGPERLEPWSGAVGVYRRLRGARAG
jgi:chemotaxis protein methyltransferase CheR